MERHVETAAGASLTLGSGEAAALREAAGPLTLPERAHLDLRFRSAPWKRVVEALEPGGRLVDFGCGPGLLAHLLFRAGFAGTYLGIDPDSRKVERARRWLPESPARLFSAGTVDAATLGAFSQATLIDVLYLVPPPERPDFLARAARALTPGGLFVALTSGGGPRWKRRLDTAQERLAVGLGITQGGGVVTCDGAEVAGLLTTAGLRGAAVVDVGHGFLHGFELVSARRPLT
ncbi:MAG: class I SAM-dependent methyltransferase [Acidobacteriota bacterium]